MDRKQLVRGIILIGAGILIFVLSNELLTIEPEDKFFEAIALIIRYASYICIVAGCLLGIISVIPKEIGKQK